MCEEGKEIKNEVEKIREVFTDHLPRYRGKNIDWKKSIGQKVKFSYEGFEGEIEILGYDNKTRYLFIKYLDKKPFKISTGNFQRCQLGKLLGKITDEFKIEIGKVFKDDKRDLIIINREYRLCASNEQQQKWYKYHCNKCGWDEGWIIEGALLGQNVGCSCCCPTPRVVVEGINDIPTTASWMIKYFQDGIEEAKLYTAQSNKKIYPICPDCGRIKTKKIEIANFYQNHTIGCSCSDGQSYPFKLMYSILEQLGIEFETEYNPGWCEYIVNSKIKTGRYDFYFKINKKSYIIETDGYFHKGDNNINGQTAKESKEIDEEKDRLANEHSIEVVRIDCIESNLEYIKNDILNSKLNNLFDLSKINWLKCEEFALSNLVKKVCKIKRYNPNMSTTDISKTMNLSKQTIIRYLKKGSKIWNWINYNPKEEWKRIVSKNGKDNCSKPIEIYKDGKSLGIFESCHELERQSEELFGIKLLFGSISSVCRGVRKQYKGYTFKYI